MMIFGAGIPRSGTKTISAYLNAAGFDVGYEATGKHCLKYGKDPEFVKRVYRDLGKGDISYLTTMALDEIHEVYPDAKFIHYLRHPYDSASSLIARRSPIFDPRGESEATTGSLMIWTPKTGIWRGVGKGGVDLIDFLSGQGARAVNQSVELVAAAGVMEMMSARQEAETFGGFGRVKLGFAGSVGDGMHSSFAGQIAAYWRMAHERIEAFCAQLPDDQWFQLKIEDAESKLPEMLDWLGSDARPEIPHMNRRPYEKAELTESEKAITYRICGDVMERYGYSA
jgi:hypothetical protein